jgi:hypothetical protein
MAGLLDGFSEFVKTPEGQGLLAATFGGLAGARSGAPINSLGRAGLAGLQGYGGALDRQQQMAEAEQTKRLREKQMGLYQAQAERMKAQAAQEQAALEADKRKREAIPTLWAPKVSQGTFSVPEMGGVEMFSTGAKVDKPSMASAPTFDVQAALRAGLTAEEIVKYAGLGDIGKQEVKDWQDIEGAGGTKIRQGFDRFGQPVGTGVNGYVAPVQVNQGDKVSFVKPSAGVTLPVGMSPSERDSSARGWAGVRQAGERLSMDKAKAAAEAANGGYSNKPLPATALKMQNEAVDAISTASGINEQLSKVGQQIKDGKLSFGPVSNALNGALNTMGMSNEQSRNLASFKSTMEKLRNDSLRLNSGVQTDGDAQRAWNELFQNINDTALVQQRLTEITAINKRAEELQRLKVDQIRGNYNAPPMDFKPLLSVPSGATSSTSKTVNFGDLK